MVVYEKQTVRELREKAKQRGLKNYSSLRKTELINLLRSKGSRKPRSKKNLKTQGDILRKQRSAINPETGVIKR